jgi:carbamate kinase
MVKPKKILVALGGNAILKHAGSGTAEEQFKNVAETARHIAELVRAGHKIAITHGNGPQIGDILLAYECARATIPSMPLDICDAESAGMIGYMLQQSLGNELANFKTPLPVVSLITRVRVDPQDPAFKSPSKPIGPFFTPVEAFRMREDRGWVIADDSGRGYRRLVPSPAPQAILETDAISRLFSQGAIIIACGGGGIPVVKDDSGGFHGVEAVIDKDHTAALLAQVIGAEIMLILTDVEKVSLHYGQKNQHDLDRMTVEEAVMFMNEGHFAKGSMEPKIEAVISFLRAGGERAIITRPEFGFAAINDDAGTQIVQ